MARICRFIKSPLPLIAICFSDLSFSYLGFSYLGLSYLVEKKGNRERDCPFLLFNDSYAANAAWVHRPIFQIALFLFVVHFLR